MLYSIGMQQKFHLNPLTNRKLSVVKYVIEPIEYELLGGRGLLRGKVQNAG